MPSLSEQIIPRRKLLLMLSETAILAAVVFLGTSLPPLATAEFAIRAGGPLLWKGIATCVALAGICQIALSYSDLYDWRVASNRAELPHRLLHAGGYALLMIAGAAFVLPDLFCFPGLAHPDAETWKIIALLALGFGVVWAWRRAFHWFFYKWNFGEHVLVFGAGPQGQTIATMIADSPFAGFELVGIARSDSDPRPDPETNELAPPASRVLGSAEDLVDLAKRLRVARVVVALEERRGTLPVQQLLALRMAGVHVEEKEAMYERITGKIAVQSLRPSYLIFGGGFQKHRAAVFTKRLIDVVVSLVGLSLSLPICLLAAILIKLDSKGPVFFSQERVGENGQTFFVHKLRTMRTDAEAAGPQWATKNDARVTRVGRVLRVARIDEIPQMLNVLTGRMSFVGPRPERPVFVEELSRKIPYYPLRHTVKPGLTGWAQVNHPYGASVEDAAEKLRYDLYYVKNISPLFDLNIILRTVGVILFGKGAR
ncbi:MAG: TIGR03013 family PEP-CTERM/XrtA system glycosyltransferase [Planctomycetes bacterium]|nr:TIGR03013 family PEP-CTERM/XrtA system glycosyltransferase [Planctomycetota bacterium]